MSLLNLASPRLARNMLLRENETNRYRPRNFGKSAETRCSLEEEIRNLRAQMVEAASREESFTSEIVIRISMLLDEKINEYNTYMNKRKQRG